jgi:lipopolysaccharide export system protein LptA
MKRIAILVSLFALTMTASAQTKPGVENGARTEKSVSGDPKFTSDEASYDDLSQVTTLLKNVSLKTEKFEFEGAKKVIYDGKTKKMKIYDCKKFVFGGTVVINDKSSKTHILEYTLQADRLYLL